MQIEAIPTSVSTEYLPYVARNVAEARRLLGQATSALADSTRDVPPVKDLAMAARNAAEHLYDLDQVDAPSEAVREALVAADAIVDWALDLEAPSHDAPLARGSAAQQLRGIDRTLVSIERSLGIEHVAAPAPYTMFARTLGKVRASIATAVGVLRLDQDEADRRLGVARSAIGTAAEDLGELELHAPVEARPGVRRAADGLADCARDLCDPEDGGDFGRARIAERLLEIDALIGEIQPVVA